MTQTETLQQTVTEFENEVTGLTSDIAELEQQIVAATSAAESAIVEAERRPSKATQKAAVDAEQERSRLATALGRKQLALEAATADLQAARQNLAASQKGAGLVELQTLLDEIALTAAAVDDAPTDFDAWARLKQQLEAAVRLYRAAGGQTPLFNGDLSAMAKAIFDGYSVAVVTATKMAPTGPRDMEIPRLLDLLRFNRARGLVRELGGN